MKEIVIISGKGGTGKTSLTASFAALAENAVIADCDVDASDMPLVLSPTVTESGDFSGGKRAVIRQDSCIGCGLCRSRCRFDAVLFRESENATAHAHYEINPIACEGCGVCAWFCPESAIDFGEVVNGEWFVSMTRCGPMVHAKLGIAEENSGKLVTLVRKKAREIAEKEQRELILVDGSPGIGCSVIASITGADEVIVVTEPTLSGEHDFQRVAELIRHFNIPALVCINKSDINNDITRRIVEYAEENNIRCLGQIPYDTSVTEAQIAGKTIVEFGKGPTVETIQKMWREL